MNKTSPIHSHKRLVVDYGVSFMGLIILLIIWQNSGLPAFILPKPTSIATKFISDATTGLIFQNLWTTFIEVIGGFFLATAIGVTLGTAIALVPFINRLIYPYVMAFQTVPKVAVAPLFLIWFGFGLESKIVTAGTIASFPILVNVITGLRVTDPRRLLLMRALKASPWEILLKVRLPGMLPYLFAGLDVAIIFSVIGAIVAEFVGASRGLGSLIVQRQSAVDVAGVFSVLIYLSLMALAMSGLLKQVTRKFAFWTEGAQKGVR